MTSGGDADGNAKGYQERARDSGHISLTTTQGFVFVKRMDNRYSDEVAVGALFLLISRMEYPLNNDVKRGARIGRLYEFLYFVTPKFPQLVDPKHGRSEADQDENVGVGKRFGLRGMGGKATFLNTIAE